MLMSDVTKTTCNEIVVIMEAFALDALRGSFEEVLGAGSGSGSM